MKHPEFHRTTSQARRPEDGIALQTIIITAILVLLAVVAGVIFIAQGRSANRSVEDQVPGRNTGRCNEVEVYNHNLGRLGIKGTNGHILFGSITFPRNNVQWSVDDDDVNKFRDDYDIPASQIDLKTVRHHNFDVGEFWNFPEMRVHADIIGRFQGSAPGCIPVCFWQSNPPPNEPDREAGPGEFYFNYSTHPEPGIGPSPQHRGVLLATSTHVHANLTYSIDQFKIPDNGTLDLKLLAGKPNQPLDFDEATGIKGVRVGTDNQSCEAYDAEGKTIPAAQAKPEPYLVKDARDPMKAQGFQDGRDGEVCADPTLEGDHLINAQNLPCYIFPYTHLR